MRLDRAVIRLCAAATIAAALAGCAHAGASGRAARSKAGPALVHAPAQPTSDAALALLEYAHRLSRARPARRSQAVIAARRGVATRPGAWAYARLALAYGTPGQQHYTPDEAARYARMALAVDDARWSEAARQYLRQYARLYTELTQARAPAEPKAGHSEPDHPATRAKDRRIRHLQVQLARARRKLHKMAAIETHLDEGAPR